LQQKQQDESIIGSNINNIINNNTKNKKKSNNTKSKKKMLWIGTNSCASGDCHRCCHCATHVDDGEPERSWLNSSTGS